MKYTVVAPDDLDQVTIQIEKAKLNSKVVFSEAEVAMEGFVTRDGSLVNLLFRRVDNHNLGDRGMMVCTGFEYQGQSYGDRRDAGAVVDIFNGRTINIDAHGQIEAVEEAQPFEVSVHFNEQFPPTMTLNTTFVNRLLADVTGGIVGTKYNFQLNLPNNENLTTTVVQHGKGFTDVRYTDTGILGDLVAGVDASEYWIEFAHTPTVTGTYEWHTGFSTFTYINNAQRRTTSSTEDSSSQVMEIEVREV